MRQFIPNQIPACSLYVFPECNCLVRQQWSELWVIARHCAMVELQTMRMGQMGSNKLCGDAQCNVRQGKNMIGETRHCEPGRGG